MEAEWGHPIIGPRGERGRVPLYAYRILQRLGIKKRYSIILTERIYEFMDPELDSISDGVRRVIGPDLTGPEWLKCNCSECQSKRSEIDHTPAPGASSDLFVSRLIDEMLGMRSGSR